MPTVNQLLKKCRKPKRKYCRTLNLEGSPQRRGICVKVYITKPKKPNSAERKIAKIKLSTGKFIRAAIPGQGHTLQEHAVVLVRAGRVRDIPGMHYRIIRGKLDFNYKENFDRQQRRSKFSIPATKKASK
jgi:small subunit ribosomal protein S12